MFEKLKGFNSSLGSDSLATNEDVVKYDLMNELNTRKGSYLSKPLYGSIIQDMIFEQMIDTNKQEIEDDIRSIFDRDGRTVIKSITITDDLYTLIIVINFYYKNNYNVDTLSLNYDLRNQS